MSEPIPEKYRKYNSKPCLFECYKCCQGRVWKSTEPRFATRWVAYGDGRVYYGYCSQCEACRTVSGGQMEYTLTRDIAVPFCSKCNPPERLPRYPAKAAE